MWRTPDAPTSVAVSHVRSSSLKVSWQFDDSSISLEKYRIYCTPVASGTSFECGEVDAASPAKEGDITGLVANTDYLVTVVAVVTDGADDATDVRTDESVSSSVTTAPDAPTSVTVSHVRSSSLKVSWQFDDSSISLEKYRIYCTPVASGTSFECGEVDAASPAKEGDITGLVANTDYLVTVVAVVTDGADDATDVRTDESVSSSVTTAPDAPTSVAVSHVRSSSLKVSWQFDDSSISLEKYRIYCTPVASGTSFECGEVDAASPAKEGDITGLVANTDYLVTVVAVVTDGADDATDVRTDESVSSSVTTAPDAPTSVTVSHVRSSSLKVSWQFDDSSISLEKYRIYCTPVASGTSFECGEVDAASPAKEGDITGLVANTDYLVTVVAVVTDGADDATDVRTDESVSSSVTTAPDAPTSVAVSHVRSSSLKVSWQFDDSSISLEKYRIYCTPVVSGTSFECGEVDAASPTKERDITGLVANTEYLVTVVAVVTDGADDATDVRSDESVSSSVTTGPPPPIIIEPITDVKSNQFLVSWTHSNKGATTKYRVDYSPTSGGDGGGSQETSDETATSLLIDTNLDADTEYSVTVVAFVSDTTESDASGSVIVTTALEGIGPPTGLMVGVITSSSIGLTWDTPSGGNAATITGYVLTWTPADGDGSMTATTDLSSPTTISGLNSNTEYSIRVTATSSSGNGDESDAVTGTTAPPPPTIIEPITDVQSNQFLVSWTHSNKGATTKYRVDYSLSSDGSGGGSQETSDATATSLLINTNLDANTEYSVTVVAFVSDTTESDASGSVIVTTGIGPPTGLMVGVITSSSIGLTWDTPSGGNAAAITGYVLTWTPADGAGSMMVTTDGSTSTTISGLNSNTEYTIQVTATSSLGNGVASDAVTGTTVIGKPTELAVETTTFSSIDMTWDAPSGGNAVAITGYELTWTPATGGGSMTATTAGSTSTTISGLNSNTEYTIQVTATSSSGNGDASDAETGTTVPEQASRPLKSTVNATTISLEWDPVPGTSSSLRYQVTCKTVDSVALDPQSTKETSATFDKLDPNTEYYFDVTASNDGGSANPSDSSQFFTVPAAVSDVTVELGSNKKTNAIVTFKEHVNGADGYEAVFIASGEENKIFASQTSSITASNLTPGQNYEVFVLPRNKAGYGEESTPDGLDMFPDEVKNADVTQNPDNPDKLLDVKWSKPSGVGDVVMIAYESLTEECDGEPNSINVSFDKTSASLEVLPGCNYTVALMVVSHELSSEMDDDHRMNSKPASPEYSVTRQINELELNWDRPDGHFEGYVMTFDGGNEKYLDKAETSYIFSGLNPYSTHSIELHSLTTDITGNVQESISPIQEHTTKSAPPEPPVIPTDVPLPEPETSSDTISYTLPENTFNDKNGPIEYYGVYITASAEEVPASPDVSKQESCTKLNEGEARECVALWTDGDGNPITEDPSSGTYLRRKKRSYEDPQYNSAIPFVIGDGTITYSPSGQIFENVPLKAETGYQVSVAAKTESDELVSTPFSEPIETEKVPASSSVDVVLIASVSSAAAVVLIVAAGGSVYVYRRRKKKKNEGERNDDRSSEASDNPSFVMETRETTSNNSRPIKLREFCKKIPYIGHDDAVRRISREFADLQEVGRSQSIHWSVIHENLRKNRVSNIMPYDANRVIITPLYDENDYINASFIPGYRGPKDYIATQGPLESTRSAFWRMVWEQNTRNIVMVTQTIEGGNSKCDHYWPTANNSMSITGMRLQMKSEFSMPEWTIRVFEISKGFETRRVRQFHYNVWPEHSVPGTAESFFGFVNCVRKAIDEETKITGPTVVHCSNGVGRTGAFIAVDHILQHIKEHSDVDIFGVVYQMRKRRMEMVQTASQYTLLYRTVHGILSKIYSDDGTYTSLRKHLRGVVNPAMTNPTYDELGF
ncbi:receptor-type tyrosine-protein phosphatase F-like [Clavelina lepadiformis]|uniref:receptor-type tyrosine-protein phosphatase F-like n=1 Tax=Clavelina lepadiformis TaxID=159417 RepID=UPI004040F6FA